MDDRKALIQILAAFMIGLTGVVGTLLLLSQGASARPMLNGASLSISKSASTDHIQVGAQLVYTLTYQNTSTETVTGVFITDTLDSNVVFLSASPSPSRTGNILYWSLDTLSEPVTATILLTVEIAGSLPNGTILTNTATIDSVEIASQTAQITTTDHTAKSAVKLRTIPILSQQGQR